MTQKKQQQQLSSITTTTIAHKLHRDDKATTTTAIKRPNPAASESPDARLAALMQEQTDPLKMSLVDLIEAMEWRHCMLRLESSPKEAKAKQLIRLGHEKTRGYALHLAVSKKPPKHIVEALIRANPDAIKSREEFWGRLPLHIASIYTASAQVLKVLVEFYDESLRITDKAEGRLPVHYACLYGSPFEISLLVSAEQRALVFKDGSGKTPLDLAHESKNPHREAILKRLEDRTRLVTEAMMQRRRRQKQQQQQQQQQYMLHHQRPPPSPALVSTTSSSSGKKKKKRDKQQQQQQYDLPNNGVLNRSQSASQLSDDDKARDQPELKKKKSKKKVKSGDSTKSSASKKQRKKKHEQNQSSGQQQSPNEEETPKLNNTNKSLSAFLHEQQQKQSGLSDKSGTPKQKNHLAMFLSSNMDSSEEDNTDAQSVGARSLPTSSYHSSSTINTNKFERRNSSNGKSLALTPYVPSRDAEDAASLSGSTAFGSLYGSVMMGSVILDAEDDEQTTELMRVEDRIKNCNVRRQALTQECQYLEQSVGRKEEDAEQSRDVLHSLQTMLAEIQMKIHREMQALNLAETGIQLQRETLALHEMKIKAVDVELGELLEERNTLMEERQISRANTMRKQKQNYKAQQLQEQEERQQKQQQEEQEILKAHQQVGKASVLQEQAPPITNDNDEKHKNKEENEKAKTNNDIDEILLSPREHAPEPKSPREVPSRPTEELSPRSFHSEDGLVNGALFAEDGGISC